MPLQSLIGDMTDLPHEDARREVLDAIPVDVSDGWWTGIVRDREYETGENRLRLERWTESEGGPERPHVWRVRPDYWADEKEAVDRFQKYGGSSPPGNLPIDQSLTPEESRTVRKDDARWVAVVEVSKPWGNDVTRLYHWDIRDGSTKQKWTVGKSWSTLARKATRLMGDPPATV
jgi:hypothetical protein